MKVLINSVDVSTRGKRRKAMALVIELLKKIRDAEEQYMLNVPLNLHSSEAYDMADQCVDIIINAVDGLQDAY